MVYLPTIHGKTLEGDMLTLPYDLDGEFLVLLLRFNPAQQVETRSWLAPLQDARTTYEQFNYYEVPVLNEFNPAQQAIVHRSIERSIAKEARRERVLPVYLNKQALKRALHITTEYHLSVMLLDREGFVHWHTEGFASLLKQAQFRRALAHIAPQFASGDSF